MIDINFIQVIVAFVILFYGNGCHSENVLIFNPEEVSEIEQHIPLPVALKLVYPETRNEVKHADVITLDTLETVPTFPKEKFVEKRRRRLFLSRIFARRKRQKSGGPQLPETEFSKKRREKKLITKLRNPDVILRIVRNKQLDDSGPLQSQVHSNATKIDDSPAHPDLPQILKDPLIEIVDNVNVNSQAPVNNSFNQTGSTNEMGKTPPEVELFESIQKQKEQEEEHSSPTPEIFVTLPPRDVLEDPTTLAVSEAPEITTYNPRFILPEAVPLDFLEEDSNLDAEARIPRRFHVMKVQNLMNENYKKKSKKDHLVTLHMSPPDKDFQEPVQTHKPPTKYAEGEDHSPDDNPNMGHIDETQPRLSLKPITGSFPADYYHTSTAKPSSATDTFNPVDGGEADEDQHGSIRIDQAIQVQIREAVRSALCQALPMLSFCAVHSMNPAPAPCLLNGPQPQHPYYSMCIPTYNHVVTNAGIISPLSDTAPPLDIYPTVSQVSGQTKIRTEMDLLPSGRSLTNYKDGPDSSSVRRAPNLSSAFGLPNPSSSHNMYSHGWSYPPQVPFYNTNPLHFNHYL